MGRFSWSRIWRVALLFGVTVAGIGAQSLSVLATFNGANGSSPNSFIQGADGNFYGTTSTGGGEKGGTFFRITPAGTLTTLYSFLPSAAPTSLMLGKDGNFYGTSVGTGLLSEGSIFKITSAGAYTMLYQFQASGGFPYGALVQGIDGNFYGTTVANYTQAGDTGSDTIFKMAPDGTLTTLSQFPQNATGLYLVAADGAEPKAGLIQGTDGNLYGTTQYGGTGSCHTSYSLPAGCGTVFKVTPVGTLTALYSFLGSTDGSYPIAALVQGTDGNFYGTTTQAGQGFGTVFQITPAGTFTLLHSFNNTDGAAPTTALIPAPDGSFYGTASGGGNYGDATYEGTIFDVSASGTLATLYEFCSQPNCSDGGKPSAMILASDGNLYGTTAGTAFKFSPPAIVANAPAIAASGGVLNGASFQSGIAPDSWITISGTNLSSKTDTWNNSIVNGALPTTLDGVSVIVGGQLAYIEYVSPAQINAVAPSVPAGSVPVKVTNPNGTSQAVTAQLGTEQPAFFQWGTYAVATRQDYSLAVKNGTFAGTTTVPAKPGDVIILWGTGFGPTSPSAPAGVETPSTTTYNTASTVSVTVGTQAATVYGAALAPGYAGLYQVAIQIPTSLANGDYPVVATINGVKSPATTLITVQQ